MLKQLACWFGFHIGRIYTQVTELDETTTYEHTECTNCRTVVDKVYFEDTNVQF